MTTDTVSNTSRNGAPNRGFSVWRYAFVMTFMAFAIVLLTYRLVQLHVIEKDFLINQGEARAIRFEEILANRGMISDRNGEPLAVSTPVETVWMSPREMQVGQVGGDDIGRLCELLSVNRQWLQRKLKQNAEREFVYLKRKVDPALARKVRALKLPGIHIQRDYKRFYPAAEVAAHVVGFVNIDELGQEGIELAYDDWLKGVSGKKKVLKDRVGNVIKDLALIKESKPGGDIQLSLDMRLQYIAYRELKAVVKAHRARAGSVVVLDANTAEVLAMVNQPSFNPNNRHSLNVDSLRNRAITDVFEPGSTVKPMTILAALETRKYAPWSKIDTSPGLLRIGHKRIRDHRNYGEIDVATVVAKSSNVGTTKIALAISGEKVWDIFYRLGFGQAMGTGFPGEGIGKLPHPVKWQPLQVATLSYGYGLNVTALHLAQAYQVIANDGLRKSVSLLANAGDSEAEQIVDKKAAVQVRKILQKVVAKGGTGTRAQVPAYTVGGKTGTVHSVGRNGYQDSQYKALFAGIVPADRPRIVMSIVIDGPQGDEYYGGEVAAPVFSRIANGAMRVLNVSPDTVTRETEIEARLEALSDADKVKNLGERNG